MVNNTGDHPHSSGDIIFASGKMRRLLDKGCPYSRVTTFVPFESSSLFRPIGRRGVFLTFSSYRSRSYVNTNTYVRTYVYSYLAVVDRRCYAYRNELSASRRFFRVARGGCRTANTRRCRRVLPVCVHSVDVRVATSLQIRVRMYEYTYLRVYTCNWYAYQ